MMVVHSSSWHLAAVPIFGTSFRRWGLSSRTTLTLACVLVTRSRPPVHALTPAGAVTMRRTPSTVRPE
jgi:hypothetical protein